MQKICRVLQKICRYCRKSAQYCRKSAGNAENLQSVEENLQVLQEICRAVLSVTAAVFLGLSVVSQGARGRPQSRLKHRPGLGARAHTQRNPTPPRSMAKVSQVPARAHAATKPSLNLETLGCPKYDDLRSQMVLLLTRPRRSPLLSPSHPPISSPLPRDVRSEGDRGYPLS